MKYLSLTVRIIAKVALVFLFLLGIPQYFFFLKDDISLAPVQTLSNGTAGVYLISYADGPEVFFKNQNALAASAINKGFDFILNYRKHHIDPQFLKDHASIFEQKKGAGFWLWKPWIILHTLETVPENAIVFYMDTGLVFNGPIHELVSLFKDYDMILTWWDPDGPKERTVAGNLSKREALVQLGADTQAFRDLDKVITATIVFVKNTPSTRAFIKKWLDACTNEAILTDVPSSLPEHPEFRNHQHDQSLLGILHHLEPQRTYLLPFRQLQKQYAFWHHRHPVTSHKGFLQEHSSLLPYTQKNRRLCKWQNSLINNEIIIWIRKKFQFYLS